MPTNDAEGTRSYDTGEATWPQPLPCDDGMVVTMVTMPDTSFVPEVYVVPRNEPDFPR